MRIAIQGEMGSNSHMAAMKMACDGNNQLEVVACDVSAEVVRRLVAAEVDGAVLPIENSLHGSVAEHYDLLLAEPVRVVGESSMRIRHNVIAMAGVHLSEVRSVLSHPVALSQCRRWQAEHPEIAAVSFYDTAGGVKHIVAQGLRDTAAIAPALAAEVYGAEVLVEGVEDHRENYTRFHLLVRDGTGTGLGGRREHLGSGLAGQDFGLADKMSVAFAVEHRPGTLVEALKLLAEVGADLTKIESRPVPGRPWEYVFYVDLRFREASVATAALEGLRGRCVMVKELGRYKASANG